MKKLFVLFVFLFNSIALLAEPVETTFQDYAFDFTEVGYEIVFVAYVMHFGYSTPTDSFLVQADGYHVSMKLDQLSRQGKRNFAKYVNRHCKETHAGPSCTVRVTGEVMLNRDFKITIWAQRISVLEQDRVTVIGTYE